MDDSITIFTNPQFGTVRAVVKDGEPWFSLVDLCSALNIYNTRNVAARLSDDMKGVHLMDTPGGKQNVTIVSEAGMYEVVIRSDKPEAVAFRRWITSEVLPAIRKHGGYLTPEAIEKTLTDPDFIIRLATALKDEQAKRLEAEQKVAVLTPKAEFYDAVAGSKDAISIGVLAKVLAVPGLGQNNLFRLLREKGILDRDNIPHQEYIDRGYFRVIEQKFNTGTGETRISFKTLVFPRGQDWIRKQVSA